MNANVTTRVEISPGELIDRHTILLIKSRRITDEAKLANVEPELARIAALTSRLPWTEELELLANDLLEINCDLWQIEDDLRDCERQRRFDARFVDLARAVYRRNDARAATKRKIDERLGSHIVEEKSYRPLTSGGAA